MPTFKILRNLNVGGKNISTLYSLVEKSENQLNFSTVVFSMNEN